MDVKYPQNRRPISREEYERRKLNSARQSASKSRKKRKSSKFLLYVMTAFMLAFILTALSCTVLFPVKTFKVTGNSAVSAADVIAASGVKPGQNMVIANSSKIAASIKDKLPMVAGVTVKKSLTGALSISVIESKVKAAFYSNGKYISVDQLGNIVSVTDSVANVPLISGVKLKNPQVKQKFVVDCAVPVSTNDTSSGTVNNASIASSIDTVFHNIIAKNSGLVSAFDLSNTYSMKMVYGKNYIINLGDTTNLDYKMSFLTPMLEKLDSAGDPGEIDLSYLSDKSGKAYFRRMDISSDVKALMKNCGVAPDVVPVNENSSTASKTNSINTASSLTSSVNNSHPVGSTSSVVNIFAQTKAQTDTSSSSSSTSSVNNSGNTGN